MGPKSARVRARRSSNPSAAARSSALCLSWAMLLLAKRPAAVEGFAVVPHGSVPGARYSHAAAAAAMGGEPGRTASCLFFMGGGSGGGGDNDDGTKGDNAKKNVLRTEELEIHLPHASRANFRRRAMKFLRGASRHGDFHQEAAPPSPAPEDITSQIPDSVIAETLSVQGTVEFQRLLRIDGHFEGEVVGDGSLIIGPTAEVISNLSGLNEVYVEGILIGDCSCNKMQIRGAGCVTGNLMTGSLGMDPSVVLKGSANVDKLRARNSAPTPQAPDDSPSDSAGGGGGGSGGGSHSKVETSKGGGGGGAWAPPAMTASSSGGTMGSAVNMAKSPTAVHSQSGGAEKRPGARSWAPSSLSPTASSINMMAAARQRLPGSGVRGGGTEGSLWPRGDGVASVVVRRARSLVGAGVHTWRLFLNECARPCVSYLKRCPPAVDYYFLQSRSSRRGGV